MCLASYCVKCIRICGLLKPHLFSLGKPVGAEPCIGNITFLNINEYTFTNQLNQLNNVDIFYVLSVLINQSVMHFQTLDTEKLF